MTRLVFAWYSPDAGATAGHGQFLRLQNGAN
jgi:hypothetical protein